MDGVFKNEDDSGDQSKGTRTVPAADDKGERVIRGEIGRFKSHVLVIFM